MDPILRKVWDADPCACLAGSRAFCMLAGIPPFEGADWDFVTLAPEAEYEWPFPKNWIIGETGARGVRMMVDGVQVDCWSAANDKLLLRSGEHHEGQPITPDKLSRVRALNVESVIIESNGSIHTREDVGAAIADKRLILSDYGLWPAVRYVDKVLPKWAARGYELDHMVCKHCGCNNPHDGISPLGTCYNDEHCLACEEFGPTGKRLAEILRTGQRKGRTLRPNQLHFAAEAGRYFVPEYEMPPSRDGYVFTVFNCLLVLLNHSDPLVREGAIYGLSGNRAPVTIAALERIFKEDPDETIRGVAREQLAFLGERADG